MHPGSWTLSARLEMGRGSVRSKDPRKSKPLEGLPGRSHAQAGRGPHLPFTGQGHTTVQGHTSYQPREDETSAPARPSPHPPPAPAPPSPRPRGPTPHPSGGVAVVPQFLVLPPPSEG